MDGEVGEGGIGDSSVTCLPHNSLPITRCGVRALLHGRQSLIYRGAGIPDAVPENAPAGRGSPGALVSGNLPESRLRSPAVHSRPGTTFHLRQMKTGRMRHVLDGRLLAPVSSLLRPLSVPTFSQPLQ